MLFGSIEKILLRGSARKFYKNLMLCYVQKEDHLLDMKCFLAEGKLKRILLSWGLLTKRALADREITRSI